MPKCPNDHDSTWEDFCSVCGEAISEAAASAGERTESGQAGTTSVEAAESSRNTAESLGLTCPNCSVSRTELDVFCESCGYDFASGTLPVEESAGASPTPPSDAPDPDAARVASGAAATPPGEPVVSTRAPGASDSSKALGSSSASSASSAPTSGPTSGDLSAATAVPDTIAVVSLDREFFDRVAGGGELQFPDREPMEARVTLVGNEILIGRRSDSRGIYPEIDLSPPMDDPAVSHRHAMLRKAADGTWTVTDLDSTNGTYLGGHEVSMVSGKEKPLPLGTTLFVGAYTKIVLETL